MAYRIGIDVGGTFTDAVIMDDQTFELVGKVKVPTTHAAAEGVAAGIIQSLRMAMDKYQLPPEEVSFIAHGTTQATNALLEGDVVNVAVLGIGSGLEGYKVKADTNVGEILLAPGKSLRTAHAYVEQNAQFEQRIKEAVDLFQQEGLPVMVAAAAYSVDDARSELKAMEIASSAGMIAAGTHEVSKLYGLRVRTRTAVVNAGILPRMVETALMTEESVRKSAIKAPLMIMRCDGGVMNIEEMKKRPILTMLSGPAAGVAGALMYEKVSEGIFLEVGGTSTDISAIHEGQVVVDYAEVGGHKTYVNSLDVRTVGVAGGSMIRVSGGKIADVGPRSAHIAGLSYLTFASSEEMKGTLTVELVAPRHDDPAEYVVVCDSVSGKRWALTLSCAANAAGYVKKDHYAIGNAETARRGMKALAEYLGRPLEKVLEEVHQVAAAKNIKVVDRLIEDYQLDREQLILVGGGGGAGAVVPYLAKELGMKYKIARNAEVISPIGVALAMVRDVVERTVANPTEDDIRRIRQEAEQAALKSGAAPGTVQIHVEVDSRRNLVRATAIGATEFRTGNRKKEEKLTDELAQIAAESIACEPGELKLCGETNMYCVFQGERMEKSFWGLVKRQERPLRVMTKEGVIRLQKRHGRTVCTSVALAQESLQRHLKELTEYTDGGEKLPEVYVLADARLIDLSKLNSATQVLALNKTELEGCSPQTQIIQIFCTKPRG